MYIFRCSQLNSVWTDKDQQTLAVMSDGMHYGTYLEVPSYSAHNRAVRAQCPTFCSFTLRCQRDLWLKLDVSVTHSLTHNKVPRTSQGHQQTNIFQGFTPMMFTKGYFVRKVSFLHNGDLRLEKYNCHLLEKYAFP